MALRKKSSAILYLHNEGLSDNMAWCHTVAVKYSCQTSRQMKQACQNVNSWGGVVVVVCFSGAWVHTRVNNKYKDEQVLQSLLVCTCRESVRLCSLASGCLRATEIQLQVSLTLEPPEYSSHQLIPAVYASCGLSGL